MLEDPPAPTDWQDGAESSFGRSRERRRKNRSICNIPVEFWVEGEALAGTAVVRAAILRNLSEIGAFIETAPVPVGTRLLMKLENESAERSAEVVWLEDPGPSARMRTIRGVGVRFLGTTPASP
jgi:PilZ domain-containing protein